MAPFPLFLRILTLLAFLATSALAHEGPNVGGGTGKPRPDRCYQTNGKDTFHEGAPSPVPTSTVPEDEDESVHGANGDAGCMEP